MPELGVELAFGAELEQDVDVLEVVEETVELDDVGVVEVGLDF